MMYVFKEDVEHDKKFNQKSIDLNYELYVENSSYYGEVIKEVDRNILLAETPNIRHYDEKLGCTFCLVTKACSFNSLEEIDWSLFKFIYSGYKKKDLYILRVITHHEYDNINVEQEGLFPYDRY